MVCNILSADAVLLAGKRVYAPVQRVIVNMAQFRSQRLESQRVILQSADFRHYALDLPGRPVKRDISSRLPREDFATAMN